MRNTRRSTMIDLQQRTTTDKFQHTHSMMEKKEEQDGLDLNIRAQHTFSGVLLFCKNILKKLQKRIDEHRKVCYYIIKLRENKQNEKEEKYNDTITEKKIKKEVPEVLERMGNDARRI